MRSPILSIHPYVPAIEQQGDAICSMASRGDCDHKLVAEVRPESPSSSPIAMTHSGCSAGGSLGVGPGGLSWW